MTATDQTKASPSFRAANSRILRDHAYSLRDVPAPDEPASVGRGSASARASSRARRGDDRRGRRDGRARGVDGARWGEIELAAVRGNERERARGRGETSRRAFVEPARGKARRDATPNRSPRAPVPAPISSGDRREFQEAQEALTRGTLEVRRVGAEVRDRRTPSLERVS